MSEYRIGIENSLKPIALEFFATFSRFEFALKRGGHRSQLAWARFRVEDGQATMQLQALTARTTLEK